MWLWEIFRIVFSDFLNRLAAGPQWIATEKCKTAFSWDLSWGQDLQNEEFMSEQKTQVAVLMPWHSLVSLCILPSGSSRPESSVEWSIGDSVKLCRVTAPSMACALFYKMWVWLNQGPVSGVVSSIARTQSSWNQGMGVGVALLQPNNSNSLYFLSLYLCNVLV